MKKVRQKKAKPKEGPTQMTSMRLDPELVEELKRRADSLGIGWQTLIKMLLKKYKDAEL